MSMRQGPTRKQNGASKKARNVKNNSSNGQGNRPRNQDNARRQRGGRKGPKGGAQRQISVAANYATGQSGKAAVVRASKDMCNVVHRELISNISGLNNTNFNLSSSIALNPGIAATFPWLATIAQNWETYRFKKLRFCYYTRTGSNTVGSVVFAPDYDASDPQPPTEAIASSYEDVQEDAPWKDIIVTLSPSDMHQPGSRKYIRTAALPANLDIKTYDSGNLFVFTIDSSAAASWGKLWVEYDVDLFTPQSSISTPVGVAGGAFQGVGGMTGAIPLGTSASTSVGTSFVSVSTAGVITFLKTGTYLLGIQIGGTVMSAWAPVLGAGITNVFDTVVFNTAATTGDGFNTITVNSLVGATYTPALTATTVTASIIEVASMPFGSAV